MQSRLLRLLCVLLVLIGSGIAEALAAESVWSGLVMANNVAEPEQIPPQIKRIEGTLKGLFGYNQFKVIGQSQKTLKTGEEDWMATSKYFSLHVDCKGETAAGYLLDLQLLQEKKLLLETEAKLNKRSPLIIRGPQVGDGQLLLLLIVQ
ncbi:MAG: hypothetical protein ABJB22_01645 [Verrucomicrobiota bacterium]